MLTKVGYRISVEERGKNWNKLHGRRPASDCWEKFLARKSMLRRALTKRHLAGCSAAPQNGYGLNSEASIWEISEIEGEEDQKSANRVWLMDLSNLGPQDEWLDFNIISIFWCDTWSLSTLLLNSSHLHFLCKNILIWIFVPKNEKTAFSKSTRKCEISNISAIFLVKWELSTV